MGTLASVAAVVAVLLVGFGLSRATARQGKWGLSFRRPICPSCGAGLPLLRKPSSWDEALWGGNTCPNCGARSDKYGRPIPPKSES